MLNKISISFAATLLIQLVTMLGGVLSARLLLPQGKGELTAIMLWPSLLAAIGSLGIFDAMTYFIANNTNDLTKTFSSGMVLFLILSAGLVGIGYFILPVVLSGNNATVVNTAKMYLAYIPINLVTLSLMALILGRMKLLEYNVLRTFVHVCFVAGMLFLYAFDHVSVRGFAGASLVANISTLIVVVALLLSHGWLKWQPDILKMKELLVYGLKVHLGSVASLLNLRLDQMVMSIFLQPITLGLYVVAVTVSSAALLGANTIALVAFPYIASLRSPQDKWQAVGRFMRLGVLLSFVTSMALLWLTPWILKFFFGVAYLPATRPARILLLASIPLTCNVLLAAGFKALGYPLVASKAELISLVVTGVSLCILLPRYQAVGAAWASLLAYLTSCVFMLYSPQRQLGITLTNLFRPSASDWEYAIRQLILLRNRLVDSFK
jgi:O-antigen/teichoic acid export membrane protein